MPKIPTITVSRWYPLMLARFCAFLPKCVHIQEMFVMRDICACVILCSLRQPRNTYVHLSIIELVSGPQLHTPVLDSCTANVRANNKVQTQQPPALLILLMIYNKLS